MRSLHVLREGSVSGGMTGLQLRALLSRQRWCNLWDSVSLSLQGRNIEGANCGSLGDGTLVGKGSDMSPGCHSDLSFVSCSPSFILP